MWNSILIQISSSAGRCRKLVYLRQRVVVLFIAFIGAISHFLRDLRQSRLRILICQEALQRYYDSLGLFTFFTCKNKTFAMNQKHLTYKLDKINSKHLQHENIKPHKPVTEKHGNLLYLIENEKIFGKSKLATRLEFHIGPQSLGRGNG